MTRDSAKREAIVQDLSAKHWFWLKVSALIMCVPSIYLYLMAIAGGAKTVLDAIEIFGMISFASLGIFLAPFLVTVGIWRKRTKEIRSMKILSIILLLFYLIMILIPVFGEDVICIEFPASCALSPFFYIACAVYLIALYASMRAERIRRLAI